MSDDLFRFYVAHRFRWTLAEVDAIPLHLLRYLLTDRP